MWGIVPAAGEGSRLQPLGFSKELLPVGSRFENGRLAPKAVCEYVLERLVLAGATKLCVVIAPGKPDIPRRLGASFMGAPICYLVQPEPAGLCDAVFRAAPFVSAEERVAVGLPDTIWFPADALARLPASVLALLLFPSQRPELFDAAEQDETGRVTRIDVKAASPCSSWIWGAMAMPGAVFHALATLWRSGPGHHYLGALLNEHIEAGGLCLGVRAGAQYLDVGMVEGWREALRVLDAPEGVRDVTP